MTFFGLTGPALARARTCFILLPAFLLFGFNQSNFGGVLSYPSFVKHFPQIDTSTTTGAQEAHNATLQGTVTASYTISNLVGALGMSLIGNRLGRRRSMIIAVLTCSVGMIIEASSFSISQLVTGRIVAGIGNGGINVVVVAWQSEVAKPRSRGKEVVIIGTFISCGISIVSWINYGLSFRQDFEYAWRLPIALPLIFACILLVCIMQFPESPRWLLSKGRIDEARENMILLAGVHANREVIDVEINGITRIINEASTRERGFIDFFRKNSQRLFYRLCLAIFVNFFAQMTGATLIAYYGTIIFKQSLRLPAQKAALLNAGVVTWKIFAALSAYLTVDRVGRKLLFMVAGTGMAISMAGLAGTVWAIDNAYTAGAPIAATFFLFLYSTFFPIGFLGANFLYAAEIAPQDLRIYVAGAGTATHWLFNFVQAEITPVAVVTISWRYYIVWASISASIPFTVYFFFPETKGRSLEDMNAMFCEPKNWWNVPAYAKVMKRSVLTELENDENVKLAQEFEHVEQAPVDYPIKN